MAARAASPPIGLIGPLWPLRPCCVIDALVSTFVYFVFSSGCWASLWAWKKLENCPNGPVLSPARDWRTNFFNHYL